MIHALREKDKVHGKQPPLLSEECDLKGRHLEQGLSKAPTSYDLQGCEAAVTHLALFASDLSLRLRKNSDCSKAFVRSSRVDGGKGGPPGRKGMSNAAAGPPAVVNNSILSYPSEQEKAHKVQFDSQRKQLELQRWRHKEMSTLSLLLKCAQVKSIPLL